MLFQINEIFNLSSESFFICDGLLLRTVKYKQNYPVTSRLSSQFLTYNGGVIQFNIFKHFSLLILSSIILYLIYDSLPVSNQFRILQTFVFTMTIQKNIIRYSIFKGEWKYHRGFQHVLIRMYDKIHTYLYMCIYV